MKETLHARYNRERLSEETIEIEEGFIVYKIVGEECVIVDLYVCPEIRQHKVGTSLANQVLMIAQDAGCKMLSCSVYLNTNNPTESLKAIIAYGFKLHHTIENGIILFKEI